MAPVPISRVLAALRRELPRWRTTTIDAERETGANPFRVLIATLLSQRTRDEATAEATDRLFAVASTPAEMRALPESRIASLIRPAGFYRMKAKAIRRLCAQLLETHGGQVPADLDTLCALPGVGRKTANLVMTHGFGQDAICVDVHVHRILNRLGYIRTKTPDETERRLRAKLPRRHWQEINGLLVAFGQNICRPISPRCSECHVTAHCRRIGVGVSR